MGNAFTILHAVIVPREFPISEIAMASALKIVSYLPSNRYRGMAIPFALNQEDWRLGLKKIGSHIMMQNVGPPAL
jgi:hypothetical protein